VENSNNVIYLPLDKFNAKPVDTTALPNPITEAAMPTQTQEQIKMRNNSRTRRERP
jgi:hypothetical protein